SSSVGGAITPRYTRALHQFFRRRGGDGLTDGKEEADLQEGGQRQESGTKKDTVSETETETGGRRAPGGRGRPNRQGGSSRGHLGIHEVGYAAPRYLSRLRPERREPEACAAHPNDAAPRAT